MNRAFIYGFVDELEKRAFLGKKEINQLQQGLKKLQQGLSKKPQIETVPSGKDMVEEKPVRPGGVMESVKSMAGDVVRKVQDLKPKKAPRIKPMRRKTEAFRNPKPGLVSRVKGWFGRRR
jgi:hypothetical protein